MESNWRWNVADAAMAHSDWELVARYLSGTWEGAYLVKKFDRPWLEVWELALFGSTFGDPTTYVLLNNAEYVGVPFPGGADVEPDSP